MSVALPARLHRINGIDMVIVALLAVLVAVSAQMALAQGVTIAAIVNDEIISAYDVEQRVLLITRSSRLPDTAERRRGLRPSMVRRLINEALQRQEAKKRNIVSDEADLSRAHQILEQNNRLAEGQFKSFIRNMGVDIEVLKQQAPCRNPLGQADRQSAQETGRSDRGRRRRGPCSDWKRTVGGGEYLCFRDIAVARCRRVRRGAKKSPYLGGTTTEWCSLQCFGAPIQPRPDRSPRWRGRLGSLKPDARRAIARGRQDAPWLGLVPDRHR